MYLLYTAVIVAFFLAASPYFAWQALRHRKYVGSLGQRFGRLPVGVNAEGEPSI